MTSDHSDDIETRECDDCHGSFDVDTMTRGEDWIRCEACEEAAWAEVERRFGWMKKHVEDAVRAEREGDFETARAITESCGVRYQGRVA